jgi:histidinol phosphatase-like enzyme
MILQAAPDLDLNLAGSAMVGNSLDDMKAASAAGVGLRILLGSCDDITALDGPMQDVADLAAALALLRARMQSDG